MLPSGQVSNPSSWSAGELGLIEAKSSWWGYSAPYLAEFVGTFLLTLTFLCNASGKGDPVWAVTSNALAVMVATYSLSHISGANLNPSVSVALWLAGRHRFKVAAMFCASQILGGSAAALLRYSVSTISDVDFGPRQGYGASEALFVEFVFTALICFVYLNTAASKWNNPVGDQNGFVGLAVGLCFVAGGYASASVSGTVMNPAISVGMQLIEMRSISPESWAAAYLLPEFLAAFISVGAYRIVRPREFEKEDSLLDRWTWSAPVSGKVMAEFIGTFFWVFTKAMSHLGRSRAEAWSVAAVLATMVYSLRSVSGGFFNPASTIAATVSSPSLCTPHLCVVYILAQLFAGSCASSAVYLIHNEASVPVRPNATFPAGSSIIGEAAFTFLFCYVVLAAGVAVPGASRKHQDNMAGLAVGLAVGVGGLAVGSITGGVLNPAMALGFTGLSAFSGHGGRQCLGYVIYEVVGGLMAAAVFRATHQRYLLKLEEVCQQEDAEAAEVEPVLQA